MSKSIIIANKVKHKNRYKHSDPFKFHYIFISIEFVFTNLCVSQHSEPKKTCRLAFIKSSQILKLELMKQRTP